MIVEPVYERMTVAQRNAWWLEQIHAVADVETIWSGQYPPDPVEVAHRLVDRLEDGFVPAEAAP